MDLKPVDFKILAELMANSKISDRQLAKKLGVSQPTVTRRRARLEKEIIDSYTLIPKWGELGFEIMAFTFMRGRDRGIEPGELQESIEKSAEWFSKEPNVVYAAAGIGMDQHGIIISFHKKFSTLVSFERRLRIELSEYVSSTSTFIVDISPGIVSKPFHFRYLSGVE